MTVDSAGDGASRADSEADRLAADQIAAARRLLPPSGGNAALDRLASLAARLLNATSAQVSVLTDVMTVAGGSGLPPGSVGTETPLSEALCAVPAGSREPLVVSDACTDPRVSSLAPVLAGRVGAYLGVPLLGDAGRVVGALCVYDTAPHAWSESDVSVLEQLATSVVAELELTALTSEYETSRARWQLAIDAAGIGSFDWDLVSGRLSWDDTLIDMFGYDRETFDESAESFNDRVHPDDLPQVTTALENAIANTSSFEAEHRVVLPSGAVRWVEARGRALGDGSGKAVRLLGAAVNTTAAREGQARVVRVLESMPAAFISMDHDWRLTYVNAEAERLLSMPRGELLGRELWALFPGAHGSSFETTFREAVATAKPSSMEAYYPRPLNAWYEIRIWPDAEGLSLYFLDITARRAAQARADSAATRANLLAEVTAALNGTLEAHEVASRLARLVVPDLADWCVVSLADDEGDTLAAMRMRDVGWWHADPALRPAVERYATHRHDGRTDSTYLAKVLTTGESVVVRDRATAEIMRSLGPGIARDVVEELAPKSAAVLPLRAHDRILGLVTLFAGPESGRLTDADLATAGEAAARAGLALDNARLYAQQRELAEGLQRSLLTPPPEPDHLEIAVRYLPAAEQAQVGGDWYDAFMVADGSTTLVIGDVMGHDTAAAAAMGQVRGVLRGVAHSITEPPAVVLTALDRAMLDLEVGSLATAVLAKIEQTARAAERGVRVLRWSNAGHPPPLLIEADGTARLLSRTPDLLLGLDPRTPRRDHEVELSPGATVLLFTDGLVERRGASLDTGLEWLRSTAAALADLPLEELCDALLADLTGRLEDDVALLAVRAHPEDRPRPPEAGPEHVPPGMGDDGL